MKLLRPFVPSSWMLALWWTQSSWQCVGISMTRLPFRLAFFSFPGWLVVIHLPPFLFLQALHACIYFPQLQRRIKITWLIIQWWTSEYRCRHASYLSHLLLGCEPGRETLLFLLHTTELCLTHLQKSSGGPDAFRCPWFLQRRSEPPDIPLCFSAQLDHPSDVASNFSRLSPGFCSATVLLRCICCGYSSMSCYIL